MWLGLEVFCRDFHADVFQAWSQVSRTWNCRSRDQVHEGYKSTMDCGRRSTTCSDFAKCLDQVTLSEDTRRANSLQLRWLGSR